MSDGDIVVTAIHFVLREWEIVISVVTFQIFRLVFMDKFMDLLVYNTNANARNA